MKYNIELDNEEFRIGNVFGKDIPVGVWLTDGTCPDDRNTFFIIKGHNGSIVGFCLDGRDLRPRDWSSVQNDNKVFSNVRSVREFSIKVKV